MKTNHWGITVDNEIPITGVINANDKRVQWLYEEFYGNGIDLECIGFVEELKTQGKSEEGIEEELEHYETQDPYILLGFTEGKDGKYDIDPEAKFSAIWRDITIQIVKSPVLTKRALCSPCFPGQGDLGSEGEFLTFSPMPEHGEE